MAAGFGGWLGSLRHLHAPATVIRASAEVLHVALRLEELCLFPANNSFTNSVAIKAAQACASLWRLRIVRVRHDSCVRASVCFFQRARPDVHVFLVD